MTTLVTGGTGFLGRFIVRELVDAGQHVRVLARSYDEEFDRLGVEMIEGSLLDDEDLAEALEGTKRVFHLAGLVERDATKAHRMYKLHVDGTRKLMRAVSPDVEKVVVASTSGTVGVGTQPSFIADDDAPYAEEIVRRWPYYLSKIYAERACDEIAKERGIPVVQLRPTLLLGPEDYRESSTGDVVLFLQNKISAVLEGGLSFVDVRDAATTFVRAMDVAPSGEKYLLGAQNMSLDDFFTELEEISGVRGPGRGIPGGAAEFGARMMTGTLRWLGVEPTVPVESVEMARHYWYIDAERAKHDLDFSPRPGTETLRDTVRWIQRHHPDFSTARPEPPGEFVRPETTGFSRSNLER